MGDLVGLRGLGVTYSPRDPRFAGSNPTDVDRFFDLMTSIKSMENMECIY